MRIRGIYSFNGGYEAMQSEFAAELSQIIHAVEAVDSTAHEVERGHQKRKQRETPYMPRAIAQELRRKLEAQDWHTEEVRCEYSPAYYANNHRFSATLRKGLRSIDFVKNRVGVESQFNKPVSDICSACATMTIFHNLNMIDVGVEIVPLKDFANDMSTGVSYFEQFVWDLKHRGVADIDIPVLILGVTV